MVRRCRRVYASEASTAHNWERQGRLALFQIEVACERRHPSDRGGAEILVFVCYGVVKYPVQSVALLKAIEDWSDTLSNLPTFVFGDFNITLEESSVLQRWLRSGRFVDIYHDLARAQGQSAQGTCHSKNGSRRIDFCWASQNALHLRPVPKVVPGLFATHDSLVVSRFKNYQI